MSECKGDWRETVVPCPDFERWFEGHRDEVDVQYGPMYWQSHIAWHARDEEINRLHADSLDMQRQIRDVVAACLDSREIEPARQAAFLRDVILTRVDPLMMITQRIAEDRPL